MSRILIARRRTPPDLDVARAVRLGLARRIDVSLSRVLWAGATLADVGRAAGCTVANLASWRCGDSAPSSHQMESLASALGVTVSYLSLDWRSGQTRASGPAVALLVAQNRVLREREKANGKYPA